LEIKYKSHNILDDSKLKEWLKFYANWPCYPQLFISGKFIGGTEIVLQLAENGELMALIPPECVKANVLGRI
jgi:monothiol glutaredoxin